MREVDTIQNIATDIFIANDSRFAMAKTMRFTKKAIEGMNLTVNASVKTTMVEILSNGTALLPKDCSDVYKVGVIGCGGRCIRAMGRIDQVYSKSKIDSQNQSVSCVNCTCGVSEGADVPQADNASYGNSVCENLIFHGFDGGNRGELYAYRKPSFPNGQYQYDESNNRLVFTDGYDIHTGAMIVVEYRPLLTNENFMLVPKLAFDMLLHKTNTYLMDGNEKMQAEKLYRDYFYKFKRDTHKFDLKWISAILRG